MTARLLRKPVSFRPRLNELEDRTVPAGNVTASVSGGILFIQGDDQANQIRVDHTGSRSVYIRALDATTTINGSAAPLALGDIYYGYDIRMGGGDDVVTVSQLDRESLRIDGDGGDDIITVDNCHFRQFAVIYGGSGADVVAVAESWFDKRTEISTGDGDDRVGLANTFYSADAAINGGAGTNFIAYSGTHTPFFRPTENFSQTFKAQLPVAVDDNAALSRSISVTFDVAGNDRPGSSPINRGSIVVATQPAFGTAKANADGTITYTSTKSVAAGSDRFQYYIADQNGFVSNLATVTVGLTNSVAQPAAPTITITSSATSPTTSATVPFAVKFSEDVVGFAQSDLNVTGGTISGFASNGLSNYSFNVTRTAEGPIVVSIPAGAATNSNGIPSAAAGPITIISSNIPSGKDPSVVFQPNGLGVQVVTPGTGNTVKANSTITVNYTGWLASNGTIFDSNTNPSSPFTSALTNLIQGWQQGLLGQKAGGVYNLFIPSALGYGSTGQGSIPPNADLVFRISLLTTTP